MIVIYKGLSLFSNAGIGDCGVENAGVRIMVANELLKERCDTYSLNHPHTLLINGDINEITDMDYDNFQESYFEDGLFLLVSTPPCQGVSIAGRMNKFDIRNQLIKPTVNAIKKLKPLWVWIENVPTYRQATIPDTVNIVEDNDTYNRINILDFIERELQPFGYKMKAEIVNAMDYGVPQSRRRLIVILTRSDKEITFPEPTHGNKKGLLPYRTVRDVIGDLEPLKSGEKSRYDKYHFARKHPERHVRWMEATPEGQTALDNKNIEDIPHMIDKVSGELRPIKGYKTTYKRIWWDKPSPTVTMASGNISSQNNVHPRDSRALTIREVMLLQTMPDTFEFPEHITEGQMREMIGEAVPSLLAEVITKHIISIHEEK